MFTLMPVAAFAASASADLNKNAVSTAESVTVKIEDAQTTASYYVFAIDENDKLYTGLEAAGETVYNGVVKNASMALNSDDNVVIQFPDAGTYEVYVAQSTGAGMDSIIDGTLYASNTTVLEALMNGADFVDMDKSNTVRVKAVATSYSLTLGGSSQLADVATYNATPGKTAVDSSKYDYVLEIVADNGFNTLPITASLAVAGGDEVKYNDGITFTTNSGYVSVVKIDSETDRDGEQRFKLAATKAGDFKLTVKYEKTVVNVLVKVATSDVANVVTLEAPKAPIALDTTLDYNGTTTAFRNVVFEMVDGNGSVMKTATSDAKVAIVSKPADSDMGDNTALSLTYDPTAGGYIVTATTGNNVFDAEGDYTFSVTLKNGASATAKVTVKEFEEPVAMQLVYKQNTIALGGKAEVKAVLFVDANGTTKNASDLAGTYSVEYVANGLAVDVVVDGTEASTDEGYGEAVGTIIAKDNVEAQGLNVVGSTITVMAICNELDLTATAELKVVKNAVTLKYLNTNADLAVNNKLVVNTVDVDGNKVDFANLSAATIDVYVLDAPENAKYDVNAAYKPNTSDTIIVDFTASAAGEYKVQTIVRVAGEYISSVDTITVGAGESDFKDVVVISIGADKMIVNNKTVALDVAPYIENNRTMMQYNVLGAFGFDIQWVQETRSVVAEGNGIKVVMNIDSKVATVNGEEVTLDVAPTIVNGRTVVPVGFLTGTFGINPTFIYGETGLDSILFAK